MIPDSFKQDLLSRIDIVDVVSRYVRLKKGGANFIGLCPFHGEKSPSFTVSPTKQFYHCFGCGAHGNAIGFLMAHAGLGYIDAVKELAASVGMQVPEAAPRSAAEIARREREPDLVAVMQTAMDFYRAELKRSPVAIDYLKKRGLKGEVAARFRIGYAADDWQELRRAFPDYANPALVECGLVIDADGKRYDRFRGRVIFPIQSDRGVVIGFGGRVIGEGEPKYLNSPETPLFEKGREIYGLFQARDAIRASGRAVVVEGYMDVVALAQYGIANAVATLGTATTPVHVNRLLRLCDELVFCFDGDAAGRKAAWRALEVSAPLLRESKVVRFLFLPEGDDPDSFVRAHGAAEFETRMREAQTLSEYLLGELRAQADLTTAEGRARLLGAAAPLVKSIAVASLRLQVVKALAEMSAFTQDEAAQLIGVADAAQVPARRIPPVRRAGSQAVSLEWKLLCRVFAQPALVLEIDRDLLDPQIPEAQAIGELMDIVAAKRGADSVSDAVMADLLDGARHAGLLSRAQAALRFELRLDEAAAIAEFRDLLEALRRREPENERLLRQKVLKGLASPEELKRFEQSLRDRAQAGR